MTVDVRPPRLSETLQQLAIRLSKVEQKASSPSSGPAPSFGSDPAVDTITIDGIVVGSAASPATNLTLTSAAFMEDIWIDADWDAPGDGTAANYDVELARKVGSSYELVQNYHIGVGTSLRMNALEPQQTYGVRVTAINRIGVRSTPLPATGFTDITTGIDATVPGQVTGLSVSSGLRSFLVRWTASPERDVARGTGTYQLQWSLDTGVNFEAVLVGDAYTSATIASVTVNIPSTFTFYFRVRAVDNSGNSGAWSSEVSAVLGQVQTADLSGAVVTTAKIANLAIDNTKLAALAVDAAKLADSAVTSTKIANLAVGSAAIAGLAVGTGHIADASIITAKIGDAQVTTAKITDLAVTNAKIGNLAVDNAKISDLDAAKITAGTIDAARIAADSIDVNKLTASTLTSKTITIGAGGTLKIGTAPTTGILINDQGIRLYSGGVVKVALDVAGTASFEGNISASTITSSTLTSATINAGTITGATIRSASSGQRVAMEAAAIDRIAFYSGHVSEANPGWFAVGVSGSSLVLQITAPKPSLNNYGIVSIDSVVGGNGAGCNFMLSSGGAGGGADAIRATFTLHTATNVATPEITSWGISQAIWQFAGGSTNAELRLKGSGNYCFLYLFGGGTVATLNTNVGLGSGFHVLDGGNSTFQPIQASAFNVSSARAVKSNVRDEGAALDRVMALKVRRYQRDHGDPMGQPTGPRGGEEKAPPKAAVPPHIRRTMELEEIGLMADELIDLVPEAVVTDELGTPHGVNLAVLLAITIKAVQELREEILGGG